MHETVRETRVPAGVVEEEYVEFLSAGAYACGEFRCVACGYALVIFGALSRCPVCGEGLWEQDAWSPFTRMAAVTAVQGAREARRSSTTPLGVGI